MARRTLTSRWMDVRKHGGGAESNSVAQSGNQTMPSQFAKGRKTRGMLSASVNPSGTEYRSPTGCPCSPKELLVDCEEDKALPAVLIGMLQEMEKPWRWQVRLLVRVVLKDWYLGQRVVVLAVDHSNGPAE